MSRHRRRKFEALHLLKNLEAMLTGTYAAVSIMVPEAVPLRLSLPLLLRPPASRCPLFLSYGTMELWPWSCRTHGVMYSEPRYVPEAAVSAGTKSSVRQAERSTRRILLGEFPRKN